VRRAEVEHHELQRLDRRQPRFRKDGLAQQPAAAPRRSARQLLILSAPVSSRGGLLASPFFVRAKLSTLLLPALLLGSAQAARESTPAQRGPRVIVVGWDGAD